MASEHQSWCYWTPPHHMRDLRELREAIENLGPYEWLYMRCPCPAPNRIYYLQLSEVQDALEKDQS